MLCDPTWQHSFYQIFPPLATHAFNDSSSSTTFLLSNFSPPPWQPMLCDPTWQHSFYQIFPPLPTHAFNDSSSSTTFLLSNFPPPWQPVLCDPTWQHSFYQIFPPLGNPCFQWFKFKYNIPFINFSPPLATHALRPYLTTFLLSNLPPPPLATHAFNDSRSSTTFLLSKFPPPPWQPMLCNITWQHSFYQFFHPPWQPMLWDPTWQHTPPPWQPMLSMIHVQVQHSLYQIFCPPPPWQPMLCNITWQHSFYQIFPSLATHAFNDSSSSTTFLLSKFPPPPWQPMLCDPTWQHSPPPLATHAFNDSSSSTTFLLSNFPSPPLATHALRPYLTTFLLSNFPPLGNPCFQWFKFKYNIPFINFSPPLATHAFNDSGFYGFTPVWYTLLELHSIEIHRNTLLRPYPTSVSHQQFRTQVGSHNTPYTAKHSIQTRHRDTQSLNTTQKQAAILYCDPTQLLFQINNAEQR